MSNYYKPQEPLKIDGDFIYPLTTIDQVISKNGTTRLDNDVIVKSTDVLSLEEIQASTELTGKVASAGAVKAVNQSLVNSIKWKPHYYSENVEWGAIIDLPTDYNELKFSSVGSVITCSIVVSKEDYQNAVYNDNFRSGYYLNTSDFGCFYIIKHTSTQIAARPMNVNGSFVTTKLRIEYR